MGLGQETVTSSTQPGPAAADDGYYSEMARDILAELVMLDRQPLT